MKDKQKKSKEENLLKKMKFVLDEVMLFIIKKH